GTIMNSHQAAAQGPPDGLAVNVVNSIPLQVTGSLGITGTPNVNVTNPATAPVLSLNVNDPGRIPYQSFKAAGCATGAVVALFQAVPSQDRLVIQHLSGTALFNPAPQLLVVTLQNNTRGLPLSYIVPPLAGPSGTGFLQTGFDQAVLGIID